MQFVISLAGAVISVLLMIPIIRKWKLPNLPTFPGVVLVTLIAALPFLFVYPLLKSDCEIIFGVFGQIVLSFWLGFSIIFIRFWRDPKRCPPEKEGVILSAADGRVQNIINIDRGRAALVRKNGIDYSLRELAGINLSDDELYLIGVDMSLMDVHINRSPISGVVRYLHQIEGGFMSLGRLEAPFRNARTTTIIENEAINVVVVQVASRLVRRVDNYLWIGEQVTAGQKLGMIRFGSLVTVIFPKRDDIRITVKPGERVAAGESILAYYGELGVKKNYILP